MVPNVDGQRKRKRKVFFDEDVGGNEAEQFSGRQKFIIETFYVLANCLLTELERRNEVYSQLSRRFGFLASGTTEFEGSCHWNG